MLPFFSIIIPTYNRASLIVKSINSVLAQTFSSWELIIIDDGSIDNTEEVILNYKDERIKYFYQNNQERSAARNKGIQKSLGVYITFLDSDDYFLPERLESLYTEIINRNNPIAFFYTGISFETDGTLSRRQEVKGDFKSMKDFIVYGIIGTPQACIHSSILQKHSFNEHIHISEDMELWLRIVDDGFIPIFIDCYNVVALNHADRSINEIKQNSYFEMAKVLKIIFSKTHPGNGVSRKYKKLTWAGVFYGISRYNIYNGYKWKAIFYLLRSIWTMPFHHQTKHKIFLIYKVLSKKKNSLFMIKNLIG